MTRIPAVPHWMQSACQKCGAVVRVDRNIEQFDPRPEVYCAMCYPFPLLPEDMEPGDVTR